MYTNGLPVKLTSVVVILNFKYNKKFSPLESAITYHLSV